MCSELGKARGHWLPAVQEGFMFSTPASARRRASSDNPSRLQMAGGEGFNYISREHSQRVGFLRWCQQWRRSQLTHWHSQCPLHQPRTQAKRRPERKNSGLQHLSGPLNPREHSSRQGGIYGLVSPLDPRFRARVWRTGWDPPRGEIRRAKPPERQQLLGSEQAQALLA